MSIEAVIGLPDQFTVEAFFAEAGFIPCHEQDRLPLRIEGEGHSPFPIRRTKAKLLHVRVARAVQCVNAGPPQLRPELLEKARQCQNLCSNVLGQRVELRLKVIADLNIPAHGNNMAYRTYDVNSICW